ncbi:kinesin-like protein Klp98A isoform X3 [Aethina tumida]|uniref:kinesin-like protein Klp98A isoform X3 n=1 Tax=Aethina tumida TaxID=116153 RepID=UPI0021497F70|nr:kinesin-like protein Klp98A isoform X3 [Aethina tumida]
MASVKVAVRVRPFNQREIDMDAQLIIQMKGKTTGILNSKANARDENIRYKEFTFDYSYWSHDPKSDHFASQEMVYNDLGKEVIDCAFQGYNACVFAYGQTGSGKTFTMMGSPENQGLIPRICKSLFDKMSENSKMGTTHRVQVSYLEIYQERVADLLGGRRDNNSLKVREHPKKGPYVQGLTTCLVTNYNHIQDCMNRGNSHRTTAATNMNDVSSRSHAIFTITFVQAGYCDGVPSETVSKIHLVDLAGSERADATGATGQRLKEGAHINKSLVTLGSVISALAELKTVEKVENGAQKKSSLFIPYRDSVLTWLLKDSLGGNSKTIMIAAISPADCNYGETLSTLRYANRAKNIINKPTVNEDPNVKLIRELRDEISKLKALMFSEQRSDMLATLHEKEAREKELTEEWAGKWREAQAILREQRALGLRKSGPGVVLDSDRPHLVAIDDDPLSTGVTLYHLKEGQTTIGTEDSDVKPDIELKGAGMEPQHCSIIFENGLATLVPQPGAHVMLYNTVIESPTKLSQGCIIFLGKTHVFRYNDPAEAAQLRRGERTNNLSRLSLLSWSTPDLAVSMENLIDDEKSEIEVQRQNLEKEKEQFGKELEAFEKKQEAFEKRRRTLEIAQAQLEAEKVSVEKEHAEQVLSRQLREDWNNLTDHQREKEQELKQKELELIRQREELERERQKLMGEELMAKSQYTALSHSESERLVDILNSVRGSAALQEVVNQHRKQLADLQSELSVRVLQLADRQKTIEKLDKRLVELVDEQLQLNHHQEDKKDEQLENLKRVLSSRTKEELKKIDDRKQSLTLNLRRVHSAESPNSCEVNYTSSVENATTHSSDTYHTAPSSCCCTQDATRGGPEWLMSDSGVELRPASKLHDDESDDLSSNEDCKVGGSDSQSSSSIENHSPLKTKTRTSNQEQHIRRIAQRISLQKQLIVRNLDSNCPKAYLDSQIEILQEYQRQYMALKSGSSSCVLSPAQEHPLQDISVDSSPSPIKPLHTGSTSALYSPHHHLQLQNNHRLAHNGQTLYRSMPSITTDTDSDSIVSVVGYCIRGAGSKTHYEYELRICTVDDRWTILRRYSRFRDLHLAMKVRYKDKVSSIPFPAKQLFSNNESVASSRKRQLELYLRRLIDTCRNHPNCPLAYGGGPITKAALTNFSPFFRKGVFENGKYGTS